MSEFEWPSGTKPAVTVNLRGDVLIVDAVEDAPLVTITGHNGVDPAAFFARYTDEIARLTRERDEARDQAEEARAETRLIAQGAADANSLIDAIADLCGVPHDEELRRSHVSKALAEARAAAIEEAALREALKLAVAAHEDPTIWLDDARRALAAKPEPEEVKS